MSDRIYYPANKAFTAKEQCYVLEKTNEDNTKGITMNVS